MGNRKGKLGSRKLRSRDSEMALRQQGKFKESQDPGVESWRNVIHGRLRVDVDHYPGLLRYKLVLTTGFAGGSDGKESARNVGELGSIPGLNRSPGAGHSNPLQYSCLENPHRQRNLAGYSPWGHKESDTTEQLSMAQHRSHLLCSQNEHYCYVCFVRYFAFYSDIVIGRNED